MVGVRARSAWWALSVGGVAALLSRAVWSGWDRLAAQQLMTCLCLLAAVGAVVRATRATGERGPARLFAAGVVLWAAGSVTFTTLTTAGIDVPIPSAADVLWLSSYLGFYAGLTLVVRAGVSRWDVSRWLDGLVGALGMAGVAAALVVEPVIRATHGALPTVVVGLAYPLADMLLLGLAVAGIAVTGGRTRGAWPWLAAGLVTLFTADAVYLMRTADGSYHIGLPLDALWPLGLFLVANAVGRASAPARSRTDLRDHVPGVPVLFASVATGILVYDHFSPIGLLAVVLAAATLGAAIARMALAFMVTARLRASEREALTDDLTGLGNRRRLMRDLPRAGAATLALFDLDGFKDYNDTYGHPAGDALLSTLGRRLAAAVGRHGRAYRLGGDEFCALIGDGALDHQLVLARALEALAPEGEGFSVGCSYGTVRVPDEAPMAEALQLADARMYAQKDGRRASTRRHSRDLLLQILHEQQPDLEEHSNGVADLATAVGRRLGMGPDDLDHVAHAAELHDVGKVAVPAAILNKPGPLDDDEWALMRRHTIIGERILAAVPALVPVGRLVRASHERYDGTGYPDRLAGDDIPLGARVIAVCDAYSAMTTDRSYRAAMAAEDALAELRRCAGTQFDPAAVEAFAAELGEHEPGTVGPADVSDEAPRHVAREVLPAGGIAAGAASDLATITRLGGLLKVSRLAQRSADLPDLLQETCAVIARSLGFSAVVVNLVCGNGRELRVAAVEGSEEARAQLLGEVHPKALWDELLDERFVRCGAFFIPAGEAAWPADLTKHEPELPVSDDSGAWHPEDALLVPMRGSDAALLGIVSVDEPAWGRRPSDDELEILVAVVSHVTLAIEHAQAALHAQRRDAADEALAGMARELGACAGAEAVLDALEGRVRELCGPAGAGVARGPGAVVPAGALVLAVGPSARLWVAREEADEGSAQLLAPFAAQAALALTLLRRLGPASSVDLAA